VKEKRTKKEKEIELLISKKQKVMNPLDINELSMKEWQESKYCQRVRSLLAEKPQFSPHATKRTLVLNTKLCPLVINKKKNDITE
jgi:hypothetical protein